MEAQLGCHDLPFHKHFGSFKYVRGSDSTVSHLMSVVCGLTWAPFPYASSTQQSCPITTPASSFHGFTRLPPENQCLLDTLSAEFAPLSPFRRTSRLFDSYHTMKLCLEKNYVVQEHHAISVAKRRSEDCQIQYHGRLVGDISPSLMAVNVRF